MSRAVRGSTDVHALRLIELGRILVDPPTGVILIDGIPRGVSDKRSGYQKVFVAGVYLQAHRVVWMFAYGPIPPGYVINHRDGNRRNNRIENLEAVTPRQNSLHGVRSANYRGTYPDDLAPDLSDMVSAPPDQQLNEVEQLMQRDDAPIRKARKIA